MIRTTLLLAVLALTGACTKNVYYEQVHESGARLSIDRLAGIERKVDFENARLVIEADQLRYAELDLVSRDRYEGHIEARATWYAKDGSVVRNLAQQWRPIVLGAGSRHRLSFPAPSDIAESCRIEIRGPTGIDN